MSVFFSPWTLAIATVTVVGAPAGGAAPSGMFTVDGCLALVWPMVFVTAMVLPDVGLIETETLTLVSSLSPWLVNFTVNAGWPTTASG